MHKVLHWMSARYYGRVYSSFKDAYGIQQAVVGISGFNTSLKFYPVATTAAHYGLRSCIKQYRPTVVTQCNGSQRGWAEVNGFGAKQVYINHGFWPKSPNNMGRTKTKFWQSFELICGASNVLKEIFDGTPVNILTNALPQFDMLYQTMLLKEEARKRLLRYSKITDPDMIITLFCHDMGDRESLRLFNEGLYETIIKLAELAEKNNWLILLKPKSEKLTTWIKDCPTLNQFAQKFDTIMKNERVVIVGHRSIDYSLLCSDAVITSARSTVDIEAALAQVPIIRIWRPTEPVTDYIMQFDNGSMDFGAVEVLTDLDYLEDTIVDLYKHNRLEDNQRKFIDHLGITFDGRAYLRILEAIKKL